MLSKNYYCHLSQPGSLNFDGHRAIEIGDRRR